MLKCLLGFSLVLIELNDFFCKFHSMEKTTKVHAKMSE